MIALAGVSLWIARAPSGLRKAEPETQVVAEKQEPTDKPASGSGETPRKNRQPSGAVSGANVERTVTDNGAVVTKYSPKQRDGEGPAFIQVDKRGQDPRMATIPNDDLLEDGPDGKLPIVGPDGLRPMDQYARPWSGTRGVRISLVVGGLGLSQTGTQNAIRTLPPDVTLAFAASGNSLQRWMQEARRKGHEILLQIPFEPFDYPANDPGPLTLTTEAGAKTNLALLHKSLAEITNYTGIMNYMGGRFVTDESAMDPVMQDLARRGLLYLDDGTSARSVAPQLALKDGVPFAQGDLTIDASRDRGDILKKLDQLEATARAKGFAIGTGSAFQVTVDAVADWIDEAVKRGIEIVPVTAVMTDPEKG